MKISITSNITHECLAVLLNLGIVDVSHIATAGVTGGELDRISRNAMELARQDNPEKIWRQFSGIISGGTIQIHTGCCDAAPETPRPHLPACYISAPKAAPISWDRLSEMFLLDAFESLDGCVRWSHWQCLNSETRSRIHNVTKSYLVKQRKEKIKAEAGEFFGTLADPDKVLAYIHAAEPCIPADIRDKFRVDAGAIGKTMDVETSEKYAILLAEFFLQMGMPADPFKPAKAPRAQKARK